MKLLKTVGIKNLKNNLSAYLRLLKTGYCILITDRDQVVAELREPMSAGSLITTNSVFASWIQAGKIHAPVSPRRKKKYSLSPLKNKAGTSKELLDEEREE